MATALIPGHGQGPATESPHRARAGSAPGDGGFGPLPARFPKPAKASTKMSHPRPVRATAGANAPQWGAKLARVQPRGENPAAEGPLSHAQSATVRAARSDYAQEAPSRWAMSGRAGSEPARPSNAGFRAQAYVPTVEVAVTERFCNARTTLLSAAVIVAAAALAIAGGVLIAVSRASAGASVLSSGVACFVLWLFVFLLAYSRHRRWRKAAEVKIQDMNRERALSEAASRRIAAASARPVPIPSRVHRLVNAMARPHSRSTQSRTQQRRSPTDTAMFAISPLQPNADRLESAPSVQAPRSGTGRPSIHALEGANGAPHSSPGSGFPPPNRGFDVRNGQWGGRNRPRSSGPGAGSTEARRSDVGGVDESDAGPPTRKHSSSLGGTPSPHAPDRPRSRLSESSESSRSVPRALRPNHAGTSSSGSSGSSGSEVQRSDPPPRQGGDGPAPSAL